MSFQNAKEAAYEFMTAGGLNSPRQLDDIIGDGSNVDMHVEEAFENWDMGEITREEFRLEVQEFIITRPDRD